MTSNTDRKTELNPIRWPYWIAGIFLLIVAFGWIAESPSREELYGGTGKLWDSLRISAGGWSPNYLLGHSGQAYDVAGIAMFLAKILHLILAPFVGAFIAQKLLILTFLPFAFWTMGLFLRRLGVSAGEASLGALFYLVRPSMLVAIGIYEHWTVGLCFVFTPLILRGIVAVAEEGSPREIVGLGLAAGALALSYTKIAVTMSDRVTVPSTW